MADYSKPSLAGYNATPPPDDGTKVAANEITWSRNKTQLSDPLKTYIDAINNSVKTRFETTPDYDQTQAEIDAGVTPTNKKYKATPYYDARRLGWSPSATATVNSAAIRNALLISTDVVLPYEDGTDSFDVDESFTLGLWGQRIRGLRIGEPVSQTDEGIVLNVVSGFPTTGGDAAQAVFNITDRYQSIKDVAIDCNSIALHGIYGTGTECSHGHLENVVIATPTGDGVLFGDNTWMYSLDHVRVSSPGGWGFNWDVSAGGGHTTLYLRNCYVTSGTSGGYRFEGVAGFEMSACACDNTAAFFVALVGGSVGTINGADTENTEQLFDLSDVSITRPCLTVNGGRFLAYGNNSTPPDRVIYVGGNLVVKGCGFGSGESATAFLETLSQSVTEWSGNTLRLADQTNSLHNTSEVFGDNIRQLSNLNGTIERLRVQAASTPRIELYESAGTADERRAQLVIDGGVVKLQRINDALAVQTNAFQFDLSDDQWSMSGLVNYADDSAASSGGVPVGGLYRNGSVVQIRVS